MTDPGTARAVEVFDLLVAVVARHLGPCRDVRRREFAAICADGEHALELLALWPAPPERQSLVDLALDGTHDELVALAGVDAVTRDQLPGDANVRIVATGLAREVAVFGPGGEELAERMLVTVLGPCRPED